MTPFFAALFLFIDVLYVVMVALAAAGILKPNRVIGIRTNAVLRNASTWRHGHHAALPPVLLCMGTSGILTIAALNLSAHSVGVAAVACVACAAATLLGGGFWSAAVANHAAADTRD